MNADPKITIMTSREFNQDRARAKRAARHGVVSITERGRPAFVLLSQEEYERLEAGRVAHPAGMKRQYANAAEALAHPESAHLEFEIPRMGGDFSLRVPNFED